VAGCKGADHHDAAVLGLEIVDEGRPEIAGGLDGEDEVVEELMAGQRGEGCGQPRLESLPEAVVGGGVGGGEGGADGQAVGVEDLRLMLGLGGIDADEIASGDEEFFLL
jgi:hypothetical protein